MSIIRFGPRSVTAGSMVVALRITLRPFLPPFFLMNGSVAAMSFLSSRSRLYSALRLRSSSHWPRSSGERSLYLSLRLPAIDHRSSAFNGDEKSSEDEKKNIRAGWIPAVSMSKSLLCVALKNLFLCFLL